MLFAALVACAEPGGDPVLSRSERLAWRIDVEKAVDILFVVDNSPAMVSHEATWGANAGSMMEVLATIEGGLPDVHIGVVNTDLGTLGRNGQLGPAVQGCANSGDGGNLRIGDAPVQGTFVSNIHLTNGVRQMNYVGALEDVFTTMATVGTQGCAYVQPLEAMRRALDRNPANAGFLRTDARLWVVFVTPNDDCSFARGGFATDSAAVNAHECFTRTEELVEVEEYETFLRSLKTDPSAIMVSLIGGPNHPVEIVDGPEGPQVAPSCTSGDSAALPSTRLTSLVERFPNRGSFTSICQRSFLDVLSLAAPLPTRGVADPCFRAKPLDVEPGVEGVQAACAVAFRDDTGVEQQLVHACNDDSNRPCWRVVSGDRACSRWPSSKLELLAEASMEGQLVVADCLVE